MSPPPNALEFPLALLVERQRFQLTRRSVADQCGVAQREVEAWEKGERIPDRQTFKRLCGMMRRLVSTPPTWSAPRDDGEPSLEAITITVDRADTVATQRPPTPESFGAGLRRIREDNGCTIETVAELLGLTGQAVSNWETGVSTPVLENLQKLLEMLPELRVALNTGAVVQPEAWVLPVPDGGRGGQRPSATPSNGVQVMLDMALGQSDEERGRAPRRETPVRAEDLVHQTTLQSLIDEPKPIVTPKRHFEIEIEVSGTLIIPTVEQLAREWAEAQVVVSRSVMDMKELEAERDELATRIKTELEAVAALKRRLDEVIMHEARRRT